MGGLAFLAAGVAIIAGQEWWRALAVTGAIVSLVVLVFYLHPFYFPVILLNAGIAVSLLGVGWPPATLVGS